MSVTIGKPPGGLTPAQDKRDPQRYCGAGITDVVNGVRKQSDTARHDNDNRLQDRCARQTEQRQFYRIDTMLRTKQRRIDKTVGVRILMVM